MLTYATAADLSAWMLPDPPPDNADRLLRSAALLVAKTTGGARYLTDAVTSLPTDTKVLQAFNDATCAQAAFWAGNSIDPNASLTQGVVTSKSMSGRAVAYENNTAARTEAATSLCPEAMQILRAAAVVGQPSTGLYDVAYWLPY